MPRRAASELRKCGNMFVSTSLRAPVLFSQVRAYHGVVLRRILYSER